MRRTLVLGDVHGGLKALKQVLERSNFDYENDKLICLGDFADGWTDTAECFEEIFKIKHLMYTRGNHDQWLKDWLKYGKRPDVWLYQGGENTVSSYHRNPESWKKKHFAFLKAMPIYYIDEENRLFLHGGCSQSGLHPKDTDKMFLMWDRDLWHNRHNLPPLPFKEVYVGHTSTWRLSDVPVNKSNVWFMDQGGGWEGKLSLMDVDTKEFWQSDVVAHLYRDETVGRNGGMTNEEKEAIINESLRHEEDN
jgi:serine/threonine protein phosphatase 1